MKPNKRSTSVFPLLSAVLVATSLALPLPALAQVELATSPMATSTTTVVKPNLMFVLDDSGSMDWDYLPDTAKNFAGKYGYNTSQCNGNYYNPAVTYDPPVNAQGGALNATATSFTAAYKDGFNTGAGTVNLNSGFTGGSGSGASGISLTAGPAFYYTYTGSQTTNAQKNYFSTSSTFYQECNSNIGSTPGSSVFTKTRLATAATTTIVITSPASSGGNRFTVDAPNNNSRIGSITVLISGVSRQILSASATSGNTSSSNSDLANDVAAKINACTTTLTGACAVTGFSATASGSGANATVTIFGPGDTGSLITAGSFSNGASVSTDNSPACSPSPCQGFPAPTASTVTGITVNGIQIMSAATASQSIATAMATDLAGKITLASYSATASGNVVTVTGPSSASTYTPVITTSGATPMTYVTDAFPESTPAKLQNFANWYSYYSNRMLMMKTGAGLAFKNVSDKYRVGFLTMNNNVSPGIVEAAPFVGHTAALPCAVGSNACQKDKWYNKLYAANPDNSTPLREVLSRVGQYYAHKFGNVTTYKATITVSGSVATTIDDITVGSVSIMNEASVSASTASQVAKNIANQINAKQVTDFGASASSGVITITGPATANSVLPVIVGKDPASGGMTITPAAFTSATATAQLNGITPADPMEYSCQQNFTILSTDGYWNGPNTYDLANNAVGQVDGSAARPFNDGAQSQTTYTNTYTRNTFSRASDNSGCTPSGTTKRKTKTQPEIGTCTTTVSGGSCSPSNWTNNGASTLDFPCIDKGSIPPTSAAALQGTVATVGSVGGVSNTLADVAQYYYQTDLRTPALANCTGALGGSVCENNVFVSANDNNLQQHMTTFTLGLGVRGRMVYSPSYLTDTTGDFVAVKLGSTASSTVCTWQTAGTVCNWPIPTSGSVETTDDLWHAAVNGRGAYFSATDPDSLSTGISNALTSISSKLGAAAAAATSTLNPVSGNNFAYVASYTTNTWTGNLEARGINTNTGVVNENASWCLETVPASTCASPGTIVTDSDGDTLAKYCVTPGQVTCVGGDLVGTDCRVPVATLCPGTMSGMVGFATDTRNIWTANAAGTALIGFNAAYATANPGFFNAATLAGLSQWPPAADVSTDAAYFRANAIGANMVNYLRGQREHEIGNAVDLKNEFYRPRTAVIGDALESQPAFIGAPIFSYPYSGYTEFLAAQASREGTVYIGTNDGMMHAFNGNGDPALGGGVERWAFVPSMVIPNLWRLADAQYRDRHQNYVNGSPITTDICTANCSNPVNATTIAAGTAPVWKTILVAGLNGGGRGYFALDITNPLVPPVLLWEFTNTTGIGKTTDNDLGYTFGQPVVTRLNDANNTWVVVVTSGYDNGADSPVKSAGSFIPNSPAGSGLGYLYVLNAATGAMISKISTGVGTAAAPSGLAKIAGFNVEAGGNRASYIYGGDLLGNLWRFDINSSTAATVGTGSAFKLATLHANTAGTSPQPITTTPILGTVAGKRIVYVGTGKYLEVPDLSTTQVQTQYAIKDDDATTTLVNPRTTLVQQFLVDNPDGTATRLGSATAGGTTGANAVDLSIQRGWFIDFPVSGERVNIDAKLVLGTLLVATIVPSNTACAPGGSGWLNFFDYRTGAAVNALTGLTSVKYDSTIVGINVLFIEGKPVVEIVTSTNPKPVIDENAQFAAVAAGFSGKRVLWRELIPQD